MLIRFRLAFIVRHRHRHLRQSGRVEIPSSSELLKLLGVFQDTLLPIQF
jgi:hypothetical protein